MRRGKELILTAGLLVCLQTLAGAQEPTIQGIPADVYYLMPSFGKGMIYFRGQGPAQGDLNICAVDNTLRFIDGEGKELVASEVDNVIMVRIDTVAFLRSQGTFFRTYPVSDGVGAALRREVRIVKDEKKGGYGTTSRTSSTKEYGTLYAEGAVYDLDKDKVYPYEVHEYIFLYEGNDVIPLSKNNLKKLFPERKEEIEAYFKAGNPVPKKLDETIALLSLWVQ